MPTVESFYLSLEDLSDFVLAGGELKLMRVQEETAQVYGMYAVLGEMNGMQYWVMEEPTTVRTMTLETAIRLLREARLEKVVLEGMKRGLDSRLTVALAPWKDIGKKETES